MKIQQVRVRSTGLFGFGTYDILVQVDEYGVMVRPLPTGLEVQRSGYDIEHVVEDYHGGW